MSSPNGAPPGGRPPQAPQQGHGPGAPPPQTLPDGNQPTARREWGYSRGWRLFTVIILRPLLRLLMRHEWQGQENFPRTGGVILAPNHLSYADWATIALFSYSYGHRYPVFMIKSPVFEVKLIGRCCTRWASCRCTGAAATRAWY